LSSCIAFWVLSTADLCWNKNCLPLYVGFYATGCMSMIMSTIFAFWALSTRKSLLKRRKILENHSKTLIEKSDKKMVFADSDNTVNLDKQLPTQPLNVKYHIFESST
jgi:hypothetical protein